MELEEYNGVRIIQTDVAVNATMTLHQYMDLVNMAITYSKYWPVPTRIEFVQSPPDVMFCDNFSFPDVKVIFVYEGLTLTFESGPGLQDLANRLIRDKKQECARLSKDGPFLTDGTTYYLCPWLTFLIYLDMTVTEPNYFGYFWSSLDLGDDYSIHDIFERSRYKYPAAEKYSMGNFIGEETSVLRLYCMSELSRTRLSNYSNLKQVFQDGCTHIWMNEDVVIKLSFHSFLAQHEVEILSLNLPGLPPLLDHWKSGDETFMVMQHCGTTLSQIYVFTALIPDEIIKQKEMISTKLKELGYIHLDDHMLNYVVKNGQLTMIDAEVIVNIAEYNDFIDTKKSKNKYYTKLLSHNPFVNEHEKLQ